MASLLGTPLAEPAWAIWWRSSSPASGSRSFIPLTIIFILRHLPKRLLTCGIAIYAMNLRRIARTWRPRLEGFYLDHASWHWIDWQHCAMLPLMFFCIFFGVPKENIEHHADAQPGLARPSVRDGWDLDCSMPGLIRATGWTGCITA